MSCKRANVDTVTGCPLGEMAVARMNEEAYTYQVCCEAMSDNDAREYMRKVVSRASDGIQQMTEAMAMIGRYTAVNEARFKELGADTETRKALNDLLDVHEQIDRELTPAMILINDMTKKTTAETMKKISFMGVMASESIIEHMETLYFDVLGRFVYHAQIDVSGIDLSQYQDVPVEGLFSGLRYIVRGSYKRMAGYYARMQRLGVLSTSGMLTSAMGLVSSTVLMPILKQYTFNMVPILPNWFQRYRIGSDEIYLQYARFACILVQHADEARNLLPLLIDMALKEFARRPKELTREIDMFERIIRENREVAYIVGNVSKFREVRDRVRSQLARIDSDAVPLSDQVPVMHGLLEFLDKYWFDTRTRRYVIKPLCSLLLMSTEVATDLSDENIILKPDVPLGPATNDLNDVPLDQPLPWNEDVVKFFINDKDKLLSKTDEWFISPEYSEQLKVDYGVINSKFGNDDTYNTPNHLIHVLNNIGKTVAEYGDDYNIFNGDTTSHTAYLSTQNFIPKNIYALVQQQMNYSDVSFPKTFFDTIVPMSDTKQLDIKQQSDLKSFVVDYVIKTYMLMQSKHSETISFKQSRDTDQTLLTLLIHNAFNIRKHATAVASGVGVSGTKQELYDTTQQLLKWLDESGKRKDYIKISMLWFQTDAYRQSLNNIKDMMGLGAAKTFGELHAMLPTSQEVRAAWELIRWGTLLLSAVAAYREMNLDKILSRDLEDKVNKADKALAKRVKQRWDVGGKIGPTLATY
jgi:hypothetical protein